jgi:hypothetical protein
MSAKLRIRTRRNQRMLFEHVTNTNVLWKVVGNESISQCAVGNATCRIAYHIDFHTRTSVVWYGLQSALVLLLWILSNRQQQLLSMIYRFRSLQHDEVHALLQGSPSFWASMYSLLSGVKGKLYVALTCEQFQQLSASSTISSPIFSHFPIVKQCRDHQKTRTIRARGPAHGQLQQIRLSSDVWHRQLCTYGSTPNINTPCLLWVKSFVSYVLQIFHLFPKPLGIYCSKLNNIVKFESFIILDHIYILWWCI